MMTVLIIAIMVAAGIWMSGAIRKITIQDGRSALLFRNGKYLRELKAGPYWIYGRNVRIQEIDVRESALTIAGQEVLTADQLVIKISVVLSYSVTHIAQALRTVQNYQEQLYLAAQEAIRVTVASRKLDELLTQRDQLVANLLPLIQVQADRWGLKIERVVVRDFMLSGELKQAYAEVVKARMEGAAALERARSESAALRGLLNATQLMETHPGLFQLRYLQTIDQALASGVGHTLMVGMPNNQPPVVIKR